MKKESCRSEVAGTVRAPSSKSYAQRAIAAALLCEGSTTLHNMELCSDTQAALGIALSLGASCAKRDNSTYAINGGFHQGRLMPPPALLDAGESGLSARMFTPIAALCGVPVTIVGRGNMLARQLGEMSAPMESLGVRVETNRGRVPVRVSGPLRGGTAAVDASLSSQFLTGLLMALPLAPEDTTLLVSNPVSTPYINMTLRLLDDFGVTVSHSCHSEFFIEGRQKYLPRDYCVEGDWSGASCMLVAGAIAGEIKIENLDLLSLQADAAIVDALSRAGAQITTGDKTVTVRRRNLEAFEFDATHCPDLFPALVTLAANCEGVTAIKGVARLTDKECDRARALPEVFGKMGIDIRVDRERDEMIIAGGKTTTAEVGSYGDHRIAMAAAIAGLCSDGSIRVEDAEVVGKSYPGFWEDLDSIRVK